MMYSSPINSRHQLTCLAALALALWIWSSAIAATTAPSPAQDFATLEQISIEPLDGAKVPADIDERRGPTGTPRMMIDLPASAGAVVSWSFTPQVLDGMVWGLYVNAPSPIKHLVVRFEGETETVWSWTFDNLDAKGWTLLALPMGQRGRASAGHASAFKPGQSVRRIAVELRNADAASRVLLSEFSLQGTLTGRATAMRPVRPPTVSSETAAIWLDPAAGHRLVAARLGERWLEAPAVVRFPTFRGVDATGKPFELAADDPGWRVTMQPRGSSAVAVRYERQDSAVLVTYTAEPEAIRCEVAILSEGQLRFGEIGADRMVSVALGPDDYVITPAGTLAQPIDGSPFTYERPGNMDVTTPNFLAARNGDRIVFFKPLTSSNHMVLSTDVIDGNRRGWFGGRLLVRPRGFLNPATRLCHPHLSWRIETAGDVNSDGKVDWVDCGLHYRDHYIAPNPNKDTHLRDSYIYYHLINRNEVNGYAAIADMVEKLDFATGIWWIHRMTARNPKHGDALIYPKMRPPEYGDLSQYKERILAAGSRIGPHYSHDVIDLEQGQWPDELIKRGPDGQPSKYIFVNSLKLQLYYIDNVRGMATGAMFKHMNDLLQACWLGPGDTMMLDTFTAYARPGYHPDYPATGELETQAKRQLTLWLRQEKGIFVAAEGVVEGTQDVIDFAAGGYPFHALAKGAFWDTTLPRQIVPLETVIYHGSTYMGVPWYELRHGPPNYAAMMVLGAKNWEWTSVEWPDTIWTKTARRFFRNNIFWSRIADAFIVDVDQQGSSYTLKFSDGSVVWADPAAQDFWLEHQGIRYHGFTPFSDRGVMAVTRTGKIDLTIPVKDDLEILPSQPDRDKLDIQLMKTPEGFTRVVGDLSKTPWKGKFLTGEGPTERVELVDRDPVLLLRRVTTSNETVSISRERRP